MGACAASTATATSANATAREWRTGRNYIATIRGGGFMRPMARAFIIAGVLAVLPAVTQAHFKLVEPASWLVEDDRGDPQKAGPCGGSNTDWGKPSYAVTKATGGGKLHVKVQETIYHPGFYRVALAVNSPTELPADPKATTTQTERGPQSVSGEIMNPVQMPVLADGLFVHHERTTTPF